MNVTCVPVAGLSSALLQLMYFACGLHREKHILILFFTLTGDLEWSAGKSSASSMPRSGAEDGAGSVGAASVGCWALAAQPTDHLQHDAEIEREEMS